MIQSIRLLRFSLIAIVGLLVIAPGAFAQLGGRPLGSFTAKDIAGNEIYSVRSVEDEFHRIVTTISGAGLPTRHLTEPIQFAAVPIASNVLRDYYSGSGSVKVINPATRATVLIAGKQLLYITMSGITQTELPIKLDFTLDNVIRYVDGGAIVGFRMGGRTHVILIGPENKIDYYETDLFPKDFRDVSLKANELVINNTVKLNAQMFGTFDQVTSPTKPSDSPHVTTRTTFSPLPISAATAAAIAKGKPSANAPLAAASLSASEVSIEGVVNSLLQKAANETTSTFKGKDDKQIDLLEFVNSHFDIVKSVRADGLDFDSFKNEIDLATTGLLMAQGGSVRVTGAPGVGKSEFEKILISSIFTKLKSPALQNRLYIRLNAPDLAGGAMYVGTFEERVRALRALAKSVPVVLVIDEIHSLVGAGTSMGKKSDFFQMIKDETASGRIKIIGMTTDREWEKNFAHDPAMTERFSIQIKLKEPTPEKLLKILESFKANRHPESKLSLTTAQLRTISKLATRFDPLGANPRKSIRLLDYIVAHAEKTGETVLSNTTLIRDASSLYSYDIASLTPEKIRARIMKMREMFDKELIGLESQKVEISRAVSEYFLMQNTHENGLPYGILEYGDRGSGKTQIAKSTAKIIGFNFKRFVMGNYATPQAVEIFKTALAMEAKMNPFTVFLFDEIEKAHPSVQAVLLGVLDEGRLSAQLSEFSTSETEVDLSKALIFAATNAGGELANFTHTNEYFQSEAEKAGLNRYLLDRFPLHLAIPQATLGAAYEILKMKAREFIEKQSRAGFKVNVDVDTLASFLMQRVYNKSPHPEPRTSIGFAAPSKGAGEQTELEAVNISSRDLQRELGVISRLVAEQIVQTNAKVVNIGFSKEGLMIQALKPVSRAQAVANKCEMVFKTK